MQTLTLEAKEDTMAQKKTAKANEENTEQTEGNKRGQKVMVNDPQVGEIARADLIRDKYYKEGWSRGDIRKHLAEQCGHDVRYQIVFAATKTGKQGDPSTDPREQPKKANEGTDEQQAAE